MPQARSRGISRLWLTLVFLSHVPGPLTLGRSVEVGEEGVVGDPKLEEVVARGVDPPVFVQDGQEGVGGAEPDNKEQYKAEDAEPVAGEKEAVAEAGEIHEKVEVSFKCFGHHSCVVLAMQHEDEQILCFVHQHSWPAYLATSYPEAMFA